MSIYHSSTFGKINLDQLKDCYETEVEVGGKIISLDLNFTTVKTTAPLVQVIDDFLAELPQYVRKARQAIEEDFHNSGETREHIEFHLEEVEDEIGALIENADQTLTKEEQVLSIMYLKRIGFYPETEDKVLAIFDHTISEDLVDQLVVVVFAKDLSIHITLES